MNTVQSSNQENNEELKYFQFINLYHSINYTISLNSNVNINKVGKLVKDENHMKQFIKNQCNRTTKVRTIKINLLVLLVSAGKPTKLRIKLDVANTPSS